MKQCYEVAIKIIEATTDRFHPIWRIDQDKLSIFKGYCSAIDKVSDESKGSQITVRIDDKTLDIHISITCDEIIARSPEHLFHKLCKRAKEVSFKNAGNSTLNVTFVFPSVWAHS